MARRENIFLLLLQFQHGYVTLLRQEIASSDVTVRAILREHFLRETGHERGPAATVRGLCRGACRGDWARGSGGAIARLLPGPAAAGGAQERRADRGGDGTGPGFGQAPVIAAFRRQRAVVERAGSQPGPGAGPAAH